MFKSDGNGAYVVDKKLFWLMGTFLFFLLTFVSTMAIDTKSAVEEAIRENRVELQRNTTSDQGQEARIVVIEKQLDRIELKLDRVLQK